jgi:hypothetical protein
MELEFGECLLNYAFMYNIGDLMRLIYFSYSENGKTSTLNLENKWSSTILKELMTIAGGDPWKKHVAMSTAAGLPPVFGEAFQQGIIKAEVERKVKEDTEPLPSLKEYRAKNPPDVDKSSTPPEVSTPSTTSTTSVKPGN